MVSHVVSPHLFAELHANLIPFIIISPFLADPQSDEGVPERTTFLPVGISIDVTTPVL